MTTTPDARAVIRSRGTWVGLAIPVVIAMLSMIGPFSIDTPFPAFPAMASDFEVEPGRMQLVVTTYLGAFALMSVLHGPLSDAVGRRPVMLVSCGVYALASVGAALSPSLPILLAFRALQGLSAGGSTIVSRTLVRDLYDGPDAQRLMSRVAVIFSVAPAIAPVIGGLLLQVGPWPLEFWFMATLGLVLIAAILVVLPETHPEHLRTPLRLREIGRGLLDVAGDAAFHRVTWAMTLTFGGQFLYIGGAAIFVGDLLGQGEPDYWKFFAPMVAGLMLGSLISSRLAGRIGPLRLITGGLAFSTVSALAAVAIAVVAGPTLPWAVVGPSLIALGVGAAYPNQNLVLLDLFPLRRGAVMSAATFCTLMFNAIAAVTITPYAGRSVVGLAVAAALLVGLGGVVWLSHLRAMRRSPSSRRSPAGDQGVTEQA